MDKRRMYMDLRRICIWIKENVCMDERRMYMDKRRMYIWMRGGCIWIKENVYHYMDESRV